MNWADSRKVMALGGCLLLGAIVGNAQAVVLPPNPANGFGAAPIATDLAISPTGVGHTLLVPYFSAQGGNKTLLNLVNVDTVHGKVLRVRLRGAVNADSLLDFTLFLAPGDVWTSEISTVADDGVGAAVLRTTDSACTLPTRLRSIDGSVRAAPLLTSRLNPNASQQDREAGTREGYIEVFTMADLVPNAGGPALAAAANWGGALDSGTLNFGTAARPRSLFDLITAGSEPPDGRVADCFDRLTAVQQNLLVRALASNVGEPPPAAAPDQPAVPVAATPQGLRMAPPTAGITASWTVARVQDGLSFSDRAIAIVAVDSTGIPATANFMYFPQTAAPIRGARPLDTRESPTPTLSADPMFVQAPARIDAAFFDLPDLSTPLTGPVNAQAPVTQATRLSELLVATELINEFATSTAASFSTDWMLFMPTRRLWAAIDYTGLPPQTAGGPTRPTVRINGALENMYFRTATLGSLRANSTLVGDRLCTVTPSNRQIQDRSGRPSAVTAASTLGIAGSLSLCGATSVVGVNQGAGTRSGVLRSELTFAQVNSNVVDGWLRLPLQGAWGGFNTGVPVLGYTFMQASGGNQPGVLANFGLLSPARARFVDDRLNSTP